MILGSNIPVASTTTLLYANTFGNGAFGNLVFVNQGPNIDILQIAITDNYTNLPITDNYLMYNTKIFSTQTMGIAEIALAKNQGLFIYSQYGTTSFTYNGNTF